MFVMHIPVPFNPFQTDIYEVCPSPLVLAQQLTHIELERLSMIGPEEFVQAFAKDHDKDVSALWEKYFLKGCSLVKTNRSQVDF